MLGTDRLLAELVALVPRAVLELLELLPTLLLEVTLAAVPPLLLELSLEMLLSLLVVVLVLLLDVELLSLSPELPVLLLVVALDGAARRGVCVSLSSANASMGIDARQTSKASKNKRANAVERRMVTPIFIREHLLMLALV